MIPLNLLDLFSGDWRSRFQDASFRGVPFLTETLETEVGRRTIIHEYPYQDASSTEDMGLRTRKYTINAYVIGADHDLQRNRLIKALEAKGAGDLIHPDYGLQSVVLAEAAKVASNEQQRITRITLVFSQAGLPRYPEYQRNLAFDLVGLYYGLVGLVQKRLSSLLQLGVSLRSLQVQFKILAGVYQRSGFDLGLLAMSGLPADVSGSTLLNTITAAPVLHATLLAPFEASLPTPTTDWTAIVAPSTSSASASAAAAITPITRLNAVVAFLQQLQQCAITSQNGIASQNMLLQHVYPAVLAQALANAALVTYESVEQAIALRQSLHTQLIACAELLDVNQSVTSAEVINALRDLMGLCDDAAEHQLATLPHAIYIIPHAEIPALCLTWAYLHDSTRTTATLQRNPHIIHPLFVPSNHAVELLPS